ncbi:MAG: thiol:disulfide interchange protein DsbA [Rhodocyclaceae bacterium]|nr:MAG: thiol:disulfide interchange protein DsbA [Rhodocyclaceae bacterium]TND03813.1 MAG: thiol:disulfide interchange protein DsbA [Rhodocyclaceae bacterium]
MKRLITLLFVALVSSLAMSGLGFAAEPQTGRDFKPITPPLPSTKGKIEVIEFFSYGCPHCSDFHPFVSQWAAKLPKDVSFRRVPVSFNRPEWARLARIYYALEATGDLAKLDAAVFIAIHEQRVAFRTDEAAVTWAASKGADGKKFGDALASFSMQSKVQRGDQEATASRIAGVPALVVDGKFLVNNEAAGNFEELLKLTDAVIAKARQERK